MKKRDKYLRIVEWSEEDQCYIGRVPGLALGGVHGKNEAKVYEKLSALVKENPGQRTVFSNIRNNCSLVSSPSLLFNAW